MKELRTWGNKSKFYYEGTVDYGTSITYGAGNKIIINSEIYTKLIKEFCGRTIKIGTSRTNPPAGSLGEWLIENVTKVAMASYVGAILVEEGYAEKNGDNIKIINYDRSNIWDRDLEKVSDLFDYIIKNKEDWLYYTPQQYEDIGRFNQFEKIIDDSSHFINLYLKKGDKLGDYTPEIIKEYLDKDGFRLKHTISIFFLGLALYLQSDLIRKNVDDLIKSINEECNSHIDTPFCYYWFQICFFHDLAYLCEELPLNEYHSNISDIERIFIKNGLPHIVNNYEIPQFTNNLVPEVIFYNWRSYEKYRFEYMKKNDHGIVGGLLFYTDRYVRYEKLRKDKGIEEFTHNNVKWSRDILEIKQLSIAWIILAHNIWFADNENQKNRKIYQKYGLEDFIISSPKIKLSKYPLLFLLSLVDTIDPIKKRKEYEVKECKIEDAIYKINKSKIRIYDDSIIINFQHLKEEDFFEFLKVNQYWLGVEVTKENDNIKIKFIDE